VLGAAALGLAGLHLALPQTAALALWPVALLIPCIAIVNIRAAYVAAGAEERARIAWIAQGLVLAVAMFLIGAAGELLMPSRIARALAFVVIMLIPAVIMACLAAAVLARPHQNARAALLQSVRTGSIALALTVVFGAVYAGLDRAAAWLGMPRALAALAAVALAAALFVPVARLADRWRIRILES
jgi:hypothetical protein